jgi:spermidine/putrescine transport system permease protein
VRPRNDLWHFSGTREAALAVLLFLYMPIVALVAMSFNVGDSLTIWSGFGLRWYEVVLNNDDMLRAIRNSMLIATIATFSGTTIATMAALALARGSFRGRRVIEGLIGLPLVVPEIVAAIAILLFFVLIGFRLGLVSVIVAHSTFTIPFAFLPIRARLADMDPSLAEAAADLYANDWQCFRRIIFPLIWPGIAAGAMLAFIASLGDFVLAFFVSGPGATTLPVYIFGMIRMGITPTVNAISTMLILASVALLSLSYLLGRRFR